MIEFILGYILGAVVGFILWEILNKIDKDHD